MPLTVPADRKKIFRGKNVLAIFLRAKITASAFPLHAEIFLVGGFYGSAAVMKEIYPTDFFFCKGTAPTATKKASVSKIKRLSEAGNARTGGAVSAF